MELAIKLCQNLHNNKMFHESTLTAGRNGLSLQVATSWFTEGVPVQLRPHDILRVRIDYPSSKWWPALSNRELGRSSNRLARALRLMLHESGYTQKQVAGKMAVDPARISKILNGRVLPRLAEVEQLVNICKGDLGDFRSLWRAAQDRSEEEGAPPSYQAELPNQGLARRSLVDDGVSLELLQMAERVRRFLANDNGLLALLIADHSGAVQAALATYDEYLKLQRGNDPYDILNRYEHRAAISTQRKESAETVQALMQSINDYLILVQIASPRSYRRMPRAICTGVATQTAE